jgi:hypothetical protein
MKLTNTPKIMICLLLLAASSMLAVGCRENTTAPSANKVGGSAERENESQSVAEMQATSLGTDGGGLGMNLDDAYSLMETGEISGSDIGGKASPAHLKYKHFDPKSKKHTFIIYRECNNDDGDDDDDDNDDYRFGCDMTYHVIFFDSTGLPMDKNVKGVTDRIEIIYAKDYSNSKNGRLVITDSADGLLSITDILSGTPILNGDYERAGSLTFTRRNGDVLTWSHLYSIEFQNDTLVRKNSTKGRYTYLLGPAESHFEASRPDGTTLIRDTKITFNGDGTALLEVTAPDGTVSVYLVDVKVGFWIKRVR